MAQDIPEALVRPVGDAVARAALDIVAAARARSHRAEGKTVVVTGVDDLRCRRRHIGKHADLYVEVASQQLRNGHVRSGAREADYDGYAIYGSGTVRGGPVSVSLEGKHYRRFFPLSANVDAASLGFSAPEFQLLSYNSPPTAEPIYVEPLGASQVCNTGGRTRVDYRFNPHWSVYTWLGHYVSFSERNASTQLPDR